MQKPNVVLFDLDGTLIDNTELVVNIYELALKKLALPNKPRNYIASLGGMSTFDTAKALGVPVHQRNEVDRIFWEHFRLHCDDPDMTPSLVKDVDRFLALLQKDGVVMGVVTSNEKRNAKILLDKAGILHYFKTIVGREDVAKLKPSPIPIITALQNLDVLQWTSQDIWYIGDTMSDITAAKSANVTPFLIGEETSYSLLEEKWNLLKEM